MRPIRNPALKWERVNDEEVRLIIPRRKDVVARALSRVLRAPGHKEIMLDEVGSAIWDLCDGKHTLDAIISTVSKQYKMTRRECETSVGTFLKMLGDRKLLGFQSGGRRKK